MPAPTNVGDQREPPDGRWPHLRRPQSGPRSTCIDLSNCLQPIVQQLGDAGTNNILTASFNCSPGSRGTCLCDENVAYTPRAVTGSYTTDATTITIKDLSGPGLVASAY